jgi:hypothetical protein
MATKRNKENDISIPAAAAPARRKSATTPRVKHGLKRSITAASPEAQTIVEVVAIQAGSTPAESEIAVLAYTYWVGRGCQGGSPEEDWLRAEQALRARASD